jgi:uncharacterized protein YxjI
MLLDANAFLVKERIGLLKLADTYDIFDPATGAQVGIARERPGVLVTLLRFLINKQMLPTAVEVAEREDELPLFRIRRGFTLLRAKVRIIDRDGRELGHFRSKLFSLGGGFHVYDAQGAKVAEVKGDWKGWNFRFLAIDGKELGTVTKKWAGIGKELFTSADNYMIALGDVGPERASYGVLLLAAGLAIDMVFKEKG